MSVEVGGKGSENRTNFQDVLMAARALSTTDRIRLVQSLCKDGLTEGMPARARSDSKVKGTPGNELLRFEGTLSEADAEEMLRAIDDGCEKLDRPSS